MRIDDVAGAPAQPVTDRPGRVRRRLVFYVPGFDPFPARRYRELYRAEAARQAALSGYRIGIGRAGTANAWRVRADFAADRVDTGVTVLDWSDLVRAAMAPGPFAAWAALWHAMRAYLLSGTLVRLCRLRRGPMLAAGYPVAVMLVEATLAVAAGWLAGTTAARAIAPQAVSAAGVALSLTVGAAAALAVLALSARLDRWLCAHYLVHDFAFAAAEGGAYPAALERRLRDFRVRIEAALADGADEVLIVGHSAGAPLAVSLTADLIRDPPTGALPALGLLTLGQAIPMQALLPTADRLRADLRRLSVCDRLTWVDVTAPGDGCCFALCDPVAVSGVAGPDQRWPLVVSAAFRRTLRPETRARLRWRFLRAHFQYLCAFDNLSGATQDYDYFAITAGPLTLADRFAGRAHSPGRITGRVFWAPRPGGAG